MLFLSFVQISALPQIANKPHGSNDFDGISAPPAISKFPTSLSQQTVVKSLLDKTSVDTFKPFLVRMTQFPDRYYKSENGLASANWIVDQVKQLNSSASADVLLTVQAFSHSWKQPSVIARLEPRTNAGQDAVITGSHFDTVGNGGPHQEPNNNPAADDCASGSAVVFETLRLLVTNKFVPKRPIEFHWYAAEEVGLYGSKAVARDYAKRKVPVFAYLNLDQAGYVKPGTKPTIGIMTDYVTKEATDFMRLTVGAYTFGVEVADTECGYACTDNASWYDAGYNSALAFESLAENATPYNDRVKSDGTPLDTLETLTYSHILQFVRNTVGFVVELSLAP